MLEQHTSMRLNQSTYVLCSNIISALADERHSPAVYEETFKYILSSDVMKVNEEMLARQASECACVCDCLCDKPIGLTTVAKGRYIAHYKQTAAARKKVWEMKYIQSKTCRPSMRKIASRNCMPGDCWL